MRTVRYVEEAREEFLYEVEYFTKVSPPLGRRFDEAVQKADARQQSLQMQAFRTN